MVFAAIFKWGCIIAVVMTNPKDPNSPPIPVPETMEEFREMAREAMASAARVSAAVERDREELREYRKTRAEERRQDREELREYRERREAEERKWREGREEEWRKTEAAMRKMGVNSGRHEENSGRILEEEVAAQVRRDGRIAWMRADDVHSNVVHDDGLTRGECDLVVVNGDEAMAVEVKRVLRAEDVRKFSELLPRLREFFPRLVENRVLYGALAFALEEKKEEVRDSVRKKAEDAGLLLIHLVGDSELKILNPDREKLRAVAP